MRYLINVITVFLITLVSLLGVPTYAYDVERFLDNDSTYVNDWSFSYLDNSDFIFEISKNFDIRNLYLPSCAQQHPIVSGCQLSVCRSETSYGDIYVKVRKLQNGQCRYVERIIGLEGLDCTFSATELKQLHHIFAKRFRYFAHLKVVMTSQEYATMHRIIRNHCATVGNYQMNQPITIGNMESDRVFDPEFTEQALADYPLALYKSPLPSSGEVGTQNYKPIMLNTTEEAFVNLLLNNPKASQSTSKVK